MRAKSAWADKLIGKDGRPTTIYAIAFSPDGQQVIVGAGSKVLIFDAIMGEVVKKLKSHKDAVYCVAYSKDGRTFASGSADKSAIVWSSEGEGKLRITHSDSIQCMAFNPVSHELATCTETDFGLWNPDSKEVGKTRVSSKIVSCSWTNDGQHLALGHFDGRISIRNKLTKEVMFIQRKAPIWCMSWNPSREEQHDILAVGCWDQTLSFYHFPSGKQLKKDKHLGFDPCSLTFFSNGEYMCIGGSDKRVSLWTKDGIKLMNVLECEDWVWSVAHRPHQNFVAIGTNDGKIDVQQMFFNTVHGLYKNLYAIRDSMTDVIVQDLVTDRKVKIACKDYVQKIAIYENRLAVQLSDRVAIYEIFENRSSSSADNTNENGGNEEEEEDEMMFQLSEKIMKKLECNLLVVTSRNIILCQEMKLQLYDFKGVKIREWIMDALIRYVRVIGGPPTREALLVGLQNGSIFKIIIDNPFPIQLLKHSCAVKCLDLNASRTKLAIVDEQNNCLTYDLRLKRSWYQETGANSVAWNTEYDDMLCFSGGGLLNIKTDTFPVHQHKFQGIVVGFKGSKIFVLHMSNMNTVDIPQSASLYNYLEKNDYQKAYEIACLGVTDNDWRYLAMQALTGLNYEIAKKAFIRLRDVRYTSLLSKFEKQIKSKTANQDLFLAEIYAYQGRFDEAAKLFVKAGQAELAMDMLCDLRKWKEAKDLASKIENVNLKDLIYRQATIAEEDKDLKAASELYIAAGEYSKAIHIMGEHQWLDSLIEVCRLLDTKTGTRAIATCAQYFKKFKHHEYASEAYMKVGDFSSLIKLHVELQKWQEAFNLLAEHPEFSGDVYLPYAAYLCTQDKFDEAQEAYKKAGHPKEALRMIQQLGFNAVIEHRFSDASYYFVQYSLEALTLLRDFEELTPEATDYIETFSKFYNLAKIYYAYNFIHLYSELPFNSTEETNLFNIARYLLMATSGKNDTPYQISKVNIVMALAKLGSQLQNYKFAREAYQRLTTLRIPRHLKEEVDLASLTINGKPLTNNDETVPICYRCSSNNPLVNVNGDICQNCGHAFVRSFISFEILPLIEFEIDDNITDEEALELIQKDSGMKYSSSMSSQPDDSWKESLSDNVQTLSFDDPPATLSSSSSSSNKHSDPFSVALMNSKSSKVKVSATVLESLNREDIFIVNWKVPLIKTKYYRNMIPSVPVIQCHCCNLFFHEEDYEFQVLKDGGCPVCHTTPIHSTD